MRREIRRLVLAGLVALGLLALGEAAPAAFPVRVAIEGEGPAGQVRIALEGSTATVDSALEGSWTALRFQSPGPTEREIQLDGTDLLAEEDRDGEHIRAIRDSPLYQVAAWLRDEESYSRWERVRLLDLSDGRVVAEGRDSVEAAPLPPTFRLEAALRRPEARAAIWLVEGDSGLVEGLELRRDIRVARWLNPFAGEQVPLAHWFYPTDAGPFTASLLHLLGRSTAAGFALTVAAWLLGWLIARAPAWRWRWRSAWAKAASMLRRRRSAVVAGLLALWLVVAAWITVALYRQWPHVLDAVAYVFQAGVFRSGRLWLEALDPPLQEALRGPFQVVHEGRWFAQYPPGTSLALAVGDVVGLAWLVGPLAGAAMIAATALTGWRLFGATTGLLVLALGLLSPFILFQAGSFMSHPIAGALLAGALAAFADAERRRRARRHVFTGVLLGAAFVTREAAAVLFALPLLTWLVSRRRWSGVGWLALGGLPFLLVYLAYNAALTGHALLLPRLLNSGGDRFGFGPGIGFYGGHTLAAGLVNTEQMLTLLQFDLFGWPPLISLGLLLLPFLLGRWDERDLLLAFGALAFVVAYVAYFYHGIKLGPRYYFEALPWLLLLAARGLRAAAAQVAALGIPKHAAPVAVGALAAAFSLNTFAYYLPRQLERRTDYTALPAGLRFELPFVEATPLGPRVTGVPDRSLILVPDWWLYNVVLSPLNCPRLDEAGIATCPRLFALAPSAEDEARLRELFPDRQVLRVVPQGEALRVVPATSLR